MLNKMLRDTAEKYPEKTAIVYDELSISYKELHWHVTALSRRLRDIGVSSSDCVAIILPNYPEFIVSFYAVAKSNAIALPLNPLLKTDEINYCVADSDVTVIITDIKRADFYRNIISLLEREIKLFVVDLKDVHGLYFSEKKDWTSAADRTSPYEGDVLYQYSSGSTGRPKRVARTQKNLFNEAYNFTATVNMTSSDNILSLVPFFHAHGLGNCLLAATITGATLTILEECLQDGKPVEVPLIFRCQRILELIEGERVTVLPGVPYIFSLLSETPSEIKADLSNLRLCFSAGNFLSKEIYDKFYQRFGVPIRQLYGCTEAGSVSINLKDEPEVRFDSVGLPMKNIEIKVVDDNGIELPDETVGEITVKSSSMTSGYCNMPELNREVFRDGYYFTGDLGKKDRKGNLYITGRKKIFIDTGGQKVDPFEVEDVIVSHTKVKEAVVVGVRGPYQGEIVKAVVVRREECSEYEIISYCRDRLAPYKVPKIVEFRNEIPKSPIGKILRKDLI